MWESEFATVGRFCKSKCDWSEMHEETGKLNFAVTARGTPAVTFSTIHNDAPYSWLL